MPAEAIPAQLWLECLGAEDAVALRAVGSCVALGNWDPARGAPLERCACEGECGPEAARWQLAGGPLVLADVPDNIPCKLEYRYMMLRADKPGEYQWEDIGSMEVPLFSGGALGPAVPRRFGVRPLNRCLVLPKGGRVLLARRDQWGASGEGCGEAGAWREQRVWRVPVDFGVAGGTRIIATLEKEEPSDVGVRAREQLVLARRTRLLGCLQQLTRQTADRGSAPCHVWTHVGQFLGEA